MIKKKKFILSLALLPLIAISLAGCVDTSEDTSDYDTEQTAQDSTDDDDSDYDTSDDDDDSDYDTTDEDDDSDYDSAEDDGDDDMDDVVDKAAKAYYGDDTEEYNEFSEWHDGAK